MVVYCDLSSWFLRQDFQLFGQGKYDDFAVFVADIDLAVSDQRRSPDGRVHVIHPVGLTRLGVQAVNQTRAIPGSRPRPSCTTTELKLRCIVSSNSVFPSAFRSKEW